LLISYGCYKAISKWFGQKLLGVVVALCLILLPICWVSYANYQYVTACEGVFRVQVFKKQPMPESLLFDDAELQSFRKGINARDMVDKAILKFREGLDSNTFGQSQFVFKAPIKNVGVLSAPLYLVTHEIKNIKTGERLARAEDIVFGGGILGPYMALLGGDQDAEYKSCGYAGSSSGSWRPTLTSDPRMKQYINADVRLVLSAFESGTTKWTDLVPEKTTKEVLRDTVNAALEAQKAAEDTVKALRMK
jgi:hypothetical protein